MKQKDKDLPEFVEPMSKEKIILWQITVQISGFNDEAILLKFIFIINSPTLPLPPKHFQLPLLIYHTAFN